MSPFLAEFLGTALLVLLGDGVVANVVLRQTKGHGSGWIVITAGWAMAVTFAVYCVNAFSGAHLNPAVTAGLAASGRFPAKDVLGYVVAQCLGGLAGAGVLYMIVRGGPSFHIEQGFATNGYGAFSPGNYSLSACFIAEFVLTAFFLFVIHGATDKQSGTVIGPIAIGLCLTLVHLVSIPVTNTSVNPARSLATAFFAGGAAVEQLWLFWVAPILGGIFGSLLYKCVDDAEE